MRRAIWSVSAALSTVVNIAKSVKTGWKTTVITWPAPITRRRRTNRAILWAATHNRSSFMSDMFCVFVTRKSSWRRWLLCCVQGSPRTRRYVTGRPGRVKKWAWSASAVWDIWGLSWPTRWGHMWWHLPLLRQNAKRQKPWGPMKLLTHAMPMRWRLMWRVSISFWIQ